METYLQDIANQITDFFPSLIGALLILLVGWLIAKSIKALTLRLLQKTTWDEKLLGDTVDDSNKFFANLIYYLLMIFVLLLVLELLGMSQVLRPVENMLEEFLTYLPNLVGAGLIFFVGYLLARIISNLIALGGGFLDKLVEKTGFEDTDKLVSVLKKVVFILIFIPFIIQALNTLQLESISQPANNLLYGFIGMIGDLLVAAVVLFLFIWGGGYLKEFLVGLLQDLGFDQVSKKLSLQQIIGPEQSLSALVGNILYFFVVFFGIITAVDMLQLDRLSVILQQMLEVTGQIAFGVLILVIGNYISTLIYQTVARSNANQFVANIVRWGALALFIAIALRTMGIANEIIELAFGLIIGAIAVAIALSYGLGGREAAGEHFKEIIKKLGNKKEQQ